MRIVIVGAGAVGFNLASSLSAEGNDVSVVEIRAEHLARLRDRLDVSVVEGSGTSGAVLREAGVDAADLFVAVTESDEINMVACTLAQAMRSKGRRIARIRSRDFSGRHPLVPKRTFGISRIINPDEVTVATLLEAIMAPGFTDSAEFGDGEVLLRGFVLTEGSPFVDVALAQLRDRLEGMSFLVAAIDREGEIRIPTGDTRLAARDHVFLILQRESLSQLRQLVSTDAKGVHRVVIFGAGRIGVRLAEELESRVEHVVLVEPDESMAHKAAESLQKTLVLRGAITDPGILEEARLGDCDFFVATSNRDEMNLVAAALARKAESGPRVGVVTADPDFVPALSSLELDLVINERLIAVEAILRFVRPGRYLSVKRLDEQGAEIMELSVQRGSRADGRKLMDLKLPTGSLVVSILREGRAVVPSGLSEILSGDVVLLVALPQVRDRAARMFFNKKWVSLQEHR